MIDKELLTENLRSISETQETKCARETIETLLKIHRNILFNEDKTHYRIIRPENPTFERKVWGIFPARQFMLLCGWIEAQNMLVFNSDENLPDIIDLLLEHRDVAPSPVEWVDDTKHEGKSEAQLREEELRRKAAIEREKELEEFRKDKQFREDLAKNMKWTDNMVENFILTYQEYRCLWDIKSNSYKNINKKGDAWKEMERILNIPEKEMKRKIKSLISNFRNELQKEKNSQKSGTSSDNIYISQWKYFKIFQFLTERYEPQKTTCTEEMDEVINVEFSEDEAPGTFATPSRGSKKRKTNDTDEKVDAAFEILQNLTRKQKENSEESSFANYVAEKLKGYDPIRKSLIIKDITDLFLKHDIEIQSI